MEKKGLVLTATDILAIDKHDSNYLCDKGAALYNEDTFDKSVEYYRLSAAMGNDQAISNLGYCYLYGRSIEKNTSLAIAYFKIAAEKENIDAAYKLGDIYGSDKWGCRDSELSIYYYLMAANYLLQCFSETEIIWEGKLDRYPSLCFALGREFLNGENLTKDLGKSFLFLLRARDGYRKAIRDGDEFYMDSFTKVQELLKDKSFDSIREVYERKYFEAEREWDEDE